MTADEARKLTGERTKPNKDIVQWRLEDIWKRIRERAELGESELYRPFDNLRIHRADLPAIKRRLVKDGFTVRGREYISW